MDGDVQLKRCSRCGEWKPATDEHFTKNKVRKDGLCHYCKPCKAAAAAEYGERHGETIRAYSAAYQAAHGEERCVRAAAYRAANPDVVRASWAAWRAKNKDRADIKEKERARHHAHPEWNRTKKERRRARKNNLPATYTSADWIRCLEYWGYCCAVCGRPRGLWHTLAQDHWVPLSRGGAYAADNIVPLCHGDGGCNNSKHDFDAHEWLLWKFGARRTARIERRITEYFDWVKATAASVA